MNIRFIAIGLLLFSCMTFCVAKEVYDPHPGTGVDIFCKSMYALGDETGACEYCPNPVITVEEVSCIIDRSAPEGGSSSIPVRAPPV